jgi:hypothetical protein
MQSSRTTKLCLRLEPPPQGEGLISSLNSNWILIDATGMDGWSQGPAGDPFAGIDI